MTYRFKVAELKTGDVLAEVPLDIENEVTRNLQSHSTGSFGLPVRHPSCPVNWEQLILPGRSLILVLDESERIVGHGIPTDRQRDGSGVVVYPAMTLEGYLLERYVPTRAYLQRDQTAIAQDLAAVCADTAGIPLRFDCQPSGVYRDRTYADDENARVYDRLQELAAVENGFNWTVDVDWVDDSKKRVKYTFRTGYPHLGTRSLAPEHVFESPGNVTEYLHNEPWRDGEAATHVQAVGDGDGETKLMSSPVIDTVREAAGWPRVEAREQFSGVKEQSTIDKHARGMATALFGGQDVITVSVKDGVGTSLGDLALGDTARVKIKSDELVFDEVFVVVGWSMMPGSAEFKPTLARLGET